MQYISLSELPLFIKKGELYKSFHDKTSFTINRKMKFDLNIYSNNDLFILLDTLLFWQVKDFPNEVYDYVFQNKKNIDFKNHVINEDTYNYFIGLDETFFISKIVLFPRGEISSRPQPQITTP